MPASNSRVRWAIGLTALLLWQPSTYSQNSKAGSTVVSDCSRSLWQTPKPEQAPLAWANDTAYVLSRRTATKDLEKQYITADILHLSQNEISSLFRTPDAAQTKVDSITFDAREIVIDMPLVFDSVNVRFIAETIRFTQRGSVLLVGNPRAGRDSLTFIAKHIDFSNALVHPLQFVTSDSSWTPGTKRHIALSAVDIVPVKRPEEIPDFIRSLTLDEDYADLPPNGSKFEQYDVQIATPKSLETYQTELSTEMIWPDSFADKIARQFAIAPFDQSRKDFLLRFINTYLNLLKDAHQELARSMLLHTKTSIQLNIDDLGFHQYYLPRQAFLKYKGDFSDVSKQLLASIAAWNSVIVDVHSGKKPSDEAVSDVNGQLDSLRNQIDKANNDMGSLLADLQRFEGRVQGKTDEIAQAKQRIADRRDDLIKKGKTNDLIRLGTKVGVLAASVLPATAPVAIGIGVAAGTMGSLISDHNEGTSRSGLDVALSIGDMLAQSNEFRKQANAASSSWNAYSPRIQAALAVRDDMDRFLRL